jgi:tRNA nucleotidyltransferase (CCA-adding enzyme)
MHPLVPVDLATILLEAPELRRSYLVGGSVRDFLLGTTSADVDVEIFGLDYERLAACLARFGRTDVVGRSFGIVKLALANGSTYDFGIPRRDSKVAPGHKGFEVALDPGITPREAAARRDFTINAFMLDPWTGEILDFFGGRDDLEHRVLRHTGPAFVDDPLRVLRGMQLVSRFDLEAAPETLALARTIVASHAELAVERVRVEWLKWAARSAVPSRGLAFLVESGWIEAYPEIAALRGMEQEPEWHPEGDVFVHTGHCLDALTGLPAWQAADEESRAVYTLAVLTHDFGKPGTTESALKDGRMRIVSPGHEEAGGPIAESFLRRIDVPVALSRRIVPLVTNHLAHLQTLSDRAVRRLAARLAPATIHDLIVVMTADQFGRPPLPRAVSSSLVALEEKAVELDVRSRAPKPILLGRHLIEHGLEPGERFGVLLREAFDAQLEGAFADLDGARAWLASRLDASRSGT